MGITRRNMIAAGGGAAAGLVFSPIPWKLLDDTAIWSQNWSWIARPPRGITVSRASACTLCGSGCGLIARTVNNRVYSVAGVSGHPVSQGALCPAAFGAHQLPYHPLRLRTALARGEAITNDEAIRRAVDALKAGSSMAVVDERAGRTMSRLWQRFAAQLKQGRVVTTPLPEAATLDEVERLTGARPGSLGFDFEKANTILCLGAEVLDGWGTPGRMLGLWANRGAAEKPRFWYAGPLQSHTADLADERLRLLPSSEAAFALGLAGVLVRSKRVAGLDSAFARQAAEFDADQAAQATGVAREMLERTALALVDQAPASVAGAGLDEAAQRAVASLNLLLGAPGIVARPAAADPGRGTLESVADGSLAVLIHEASAAGIDLPDSMLRRKLAAGGILIRLTAYRTEAATQADLAIPVTSFLEALDDASEPREARVASWTVAPALMDPPPNVLSPASVLAKLSAGLGLEAADLEKQMREKAEALRSAKRGHWFQFAKGAAEVVENPADVWKLMSSGGVWVDDRGPARPGIAAKLEAVQLTPPGHPPGYDLTLYASVWRGAAVPLATKVEQEMRLHAVKGEALVHPETARRLGLVSGDAVVIETPSHTVPTRLRTAVHVQPGVVESAVLIEAHGAPARLRSATGFRAATVRERLEVIS